MLLDDVLLVILDVADGGDAHLHMLTHPLLVEIHARLRLADQRAFRCSARKFSRASAYTASRVRIGLRRQTDLRAIHVQQAVRLARGQGRRLFAIHHIIGDAGDFRDEGGCGAKTLKSFDAEHRGERKED